MTKLLTTIAFATFAGLAASPLPVAEDGVRPCLDDWSVAGRIVRERALVPPKRIRKLARKAYPGELIKMALCKNGERHYYRLVIFEASGKLRTITIDAASPFDKGSPAK